MNPSFEVRITLLDLQIHTRTSVKYLNDTTYVRVYVVNMTNDNER